MIWTLLPRRDWEILDTWHAAGLKGSASNDIRVTGAFGPHEFSLEIRFGPPGGPTPGRSTRTPTNSPVEVTGRI